MKMNKENFIKMPELGEGVTEGELVKWLVAVGDSINTDQVLAEVMTDKAVMEIPSPVEGVVEAFSAQEGDTIPVGHNLLKLKSADQAKKPSTPPPASSALKTHSSPSLSKDKKALVSPSPNKPKLDPIKASPTTRRWAKELNIDLSQITLAREDGRITQEDIFQHLREAKKLRYRLKD